tara:strand:- start:89 stop:280 length:192 start_codon:yes stop_codon:yes gene_type:complete
MMRMYMYSVEKADGNPRSLFSDVAEARAARQPHEYVVEYCFNLESSEPVVYPEVISLDLGGEE